MELGKNFLPFLLLTYFCAVAACEGDYDNVDDGNYGDQDLYARALVVGTYQAEDSTFQSGCAEQSKHSGYTGSSYIDFGGKGSLVDWNIVNAPSAGEYTLTFRYANGSSVDRRSEVAVNSANVGNVAFRPTGGWMKWSTASITANLSAGKNKIRVTANTSNGGPNLDKMDLLSEGGSNEANGQCALVNEGNTASLLCPNGQIIKSIDFASYGLPTGSCPNFQTGSCHAQTSKSKVQGLCLNKQSCKIGANNSVFGDPCSGKGKKLAVTYSCSGGTAALALRDFVGHYERTPVLNDWHKVDISLVNNALLWKNAAGAKWSLNYTNGILKTGSDCSYGVQVIAVEKQSGNDPIKSLKFNGELYYKRSGTDNTNDQCPNDPNKTEPGKCGCGVPETQCSGGCDQGCSAPTPICGPDSKCTNRRWVEPISTLPDKWKSQIDTSVWTKWVRSVIPVIGQKSTQDAALLEVAYYAEKIHMPKGKVLVPDLINSMLGAHPTRFSVYPACPKAYMHPAVKPTMSSGGGGWTNTLVSEDWILRYPKCTGAFAVACDQMPAGALCNNCQWQNASEPETCRDTLAHEHGHTCDLHRRNYIDPSVDALAKQVFSYNDTEGPAWAASKYFMNPSLETSTGRDSGKYIMSAQDKNYWSITHKFTMSEYAVGSGYVLKTTRCPQMGLTQACPDTLTRTYAVPLDGR